jgi:hypothetical protein
MALSFLECITRARRWQKFESDFGEFSCKQGPGEPSCWRNGCTSPLGTLRRHRDVAIDVLDPALDEEAKKSGARAPPRLRAHGQVNERSFISSHDTRTVGLAAERASMLH